MKRLAFALVISALTLAIAQNVATLRQTNAGFPRNADDQFVLNTYFGAIGAVQDSCPAVLAASLREQKAVAACATFGQGAGRAELLRSAVEAHFLDVTMFQDDAWVTPWNANADFGTVRQLWYKRTTYHLTLDARRGLARVIVFPLAQAPPVVLQREERVASATLDTMLIAAWSDEDVDCDLLADVDAEATAQIEKLKAIFKGGLKCGKQTHGVDEARRDLDVFMSSHVDATEWKPGNEPGDWTKSWYWGDKVYSVTFWRGMAFGAWGYRTDVPR